MRRFSLIICIALLFLFLGMTFRITTAQTVFICRPGETYGLSGHGPPRTAVLLYFDGSAIGGSTTDAEGSYHVKLVVGREAPGDYALEVQVRATHQVLATALCRIPDPRTDVPSSGEPAASPESKIAASPTATVAGAPTQPTATAGRATSVATTQTATASATATTTATPSLTATNFGGMTSTPSATGATATNTPSATPTLTSTSTTNTTTSIEFTVDVDDTEPIIGDTVTMSGDLLDANENGLAGYRINVTYTYSGGTGQWCSATTDEDGAWECDATVQPAMKDKKVTLTAQVSVNGQILSEETTMTPVAE